MPGSVLAVRTVLLCDGSPSSARRVKGSCERLCALWRTPPLRCWRLARARLPGVEREQRRRTEGLGGFQSCDF